MGLSTSPPVSLLGIAEFIVPSGSFFNAQTHVSFRIIAELSPNVRMILKSVPLDSPTVFSNTHEKGVRE
jgi:hypothetical protein